MENENEKELTFYSNLINIKREEIERLEKKINSYKDMIELKEAIIDEAYRNIEELKNENSFKIIK